MFYRSDIEIYSANFENTTQVGTWNTESDFQLAKGYELVPIRRFFRVGTVEVGRVMRFTLPTPFFMDLNTTMFSRWKNESQSYVFRILNDHYWEPSNVTDNSTDIE